MLYCLQLLGKTNGKYKMSENFKKVFKKVLTTTSKYDIVFNVDKRLKVNEISLEVS